MTDRLLSTSELARRYGVPHRTALGWLRNPRLLKHAALPVGDGKRPTTYQIPESALAGWTPPTQGNHTASSRRRRE